jgi:hypothetical protein
VLPMNTGKILLDQNRFLEFLWTTPCMYVYMYVWAYTAVHRLPSPLLQSIRSWASSSLIPLFSFVMPSRHDRLGCPLFLLRGGIHEWIMAGHLSLGILITCPNRLLVF